MDKSENRQKNNNENYDKTDYKVCLIISGGRPVCPEGLAADYVIACDSGLDNADRYGIVPDLVVGDFDSVSSGNLRKIEEEGNGREKDAQGDAQGINYIRYPKEKDDTDTMIAVKHALKMGFLRIKIICAFGGRADHSAANIQTAHFAADRGAVVEIIDENSSCTIFKDREMIFDRKEGCYLSVFSLSDKSRKVSILGTKYEVRDCELTNDFPLGVSNEFVNEKAAVSVKDGCLMVIIAS